jgi:hypothetical protein
MAEKGVGFGDSKYGAQRTRELRTGHSNSQVSVRRHTPSQVSSAATLSAFQIVLGTTDRRTSDEARLAPAPLSLAAWPLYSHLLAI